MSLAVRFYVILNNGEKIMIRSFFLFPILPLILFAGITFSQTLHNIELNNSNIFIPNTLTIFIGDTVRWTNAGGNHNVVADDNSFTSGAPSSAPWVYDFVFTVVGVNPYYCVIHGGPGGVGMSGVITVENPTSVNNDITIETFELSQNYPNPFNPTTIITYSIPKDELVTLIVYNVLGNEVTTLVNEEKPIGNYEVAFNATNLPSGIYFYKLQTPNFNQSKKMILLK